MKDSLLHAAGGAALYLLPALAAPVRLDWRFSLAGALSFAVVGMLRELDYVRWKIRFEDSVAAVRVDSSSGVYVMLGPFDPRVLRATFTLHKIVEGCAWGVGAGLVGLL